MGQKAFCLSIVLVYNDKKISKYDKIFLKKKTIFLSGDIN